MKYYMFQPRFAPLIKLGSKCTTIRPFRKYTPKPGETVSLRMWRGKPYRSEQVEIKQVIINEVNTVHIGLNYFRVFSRITGNFISSPFFTSTEELDAFARKDGFCNWDNLIKWFDDNHYQGSMFEGQRIEWEI